MQSGKTSEEIEVVTSSESASSTSGCDDVESDAEQEAEVDGTRRPPGEEDFSLDVMVKNTKSGIIHSVPDIAHGVSQSVYSNGELLQRKTTKCGRLTSAGFAVVRNVPDWTAKCRVCFKGCREPPRRG